MYDDRRAEAFDQFWFERSKRQDWPGGDSHNRYRIVWRAACDWQRKRDAEIARANKNDFGAIGEQTAAAIMENKQ